jgi:multiple sugar transport system permease protein
MPRRFGWVSSLITYLVVAIVAGYALFPMVWTILSSVLTEYELAMFSGGSALPTAISFQNWVRAFGDADFLRAIRDTSAYSLVTASLALVFGSLSGYSFAKFRYPRKGLMFFVMMVLQTTPSLAVVIPIYILLRNTALFDTIPGLVLTYLPFSAPVVSWLMMGFFESMPDDLLDAAAVDGCSRLGVFYRIVIPLVAPGLVAAFLWMFLSTWGEFMHAVIFTSSNVHPLTVIISFAMGRMKAEFGYMMTQAAIGAIVPIGLALIFQRYIVRGLLEGAVKG